LGQKTIIRNCISTHIPYLGLYHYLPHQNNISFIGKFSPNLNDLKNMIVTYTKDFSVKKWTKFARFQRKEKSKLPNS
jgi:hypothetical protein